MTWQLLMASVSASAIAAGSGGGGGGFPAGAVSARFWKIDNIVWGADAVSNGNLRLERLEFWDGLTRLTPSVLASDTGEETGNLLANTGSVNTFSTTTTFTFDFGAPVSPSAVRHKPATSPARGAASFDVSFSSDGVNWTLLRSVDVAGYYPGIQGFRDCFDVLPPMVANVISGSAARVVVGSSPGGTVATKARAFVIAGGASAGVAATKAAAFILAGGAPTGLAATKSAVFAVIQP